MRIPILNILLIVACLLTSCNYDVYPSGETNDDKVEVTFSMFSTDFIHPTTRAVSETITRIDLLVFDASGNFLEKVAAANINTSARTFKAQVSIHGKIVHAVANYEAIDALVESSYLGQNEHVVIPSLLVANNELVFWGRSEIANNKAAIEFIRNQAKVSVENTFTNNDFTFVGFDIFKYSKTGTVAPYINNEFSHSTELATTTTYTLVNGVDPTNNDEKYICERKNPESPNETFVILKYNYNSSGRVVPLYYRVLLRNADNKPYQIVRNVNYRIKVNNLSATVGVNSFADALTAPSLNNFYAEVMKESPSISDNSGNSLTVWPLVHMATSAGSVTSAFQTEGTLGAVTCEIADDSDNIVTSASISGSNIVINVKAVTTKSEAIVNVKYGKLERVITVIASPRYILTTTTDISTYSIYNTPVQLTINIDPDYPSPEDYPTLYPIWCYIKAPNLHPIGDNKGMFMDFDYVEGEYWYTYLAHTKGDHVIEFETNFNNIANDAIVVRSQYFNESQVILNQTP